MNFKPIFNKPIFNGVSNSFLKGWHEKASANDFQMNFKYVYGKFLQRAFPMMLLKRAFNFPVKSAFDASFAEYSPKQFF